MSHQKGFNLSSIQSRASLEMVRHGKEAFQSCPILHPAPRCCRNKAGLNKGQNKVPFAIVPSPLLQLLHTHQPVRYSGNKREELKQRRGQLLSFRQGGKVLSAVCQSANAKNKDHFEGQRWKGGSRNPLFLTCTLGGVIRTKHAGYLLGNKKQGPLVSCSINCDSVSQSTGLL